MAEYTFDYEQKRAAEEVSRAYAPSHRRRLRYSSLTRFRGGHLRTWAKALADERKLPYLAILNELQGGRLGATVAGLSTQDLLADEVAEDATSTTNPDAVNTRTHLDEATGYAVELPRISVNLSSTVFDFTGFSAGDMLAIRFDDLTTGDTWQNYRPYPLVANINGNRLYFPPGHDVPSADGYGTAASVIRALQNPTQVSIIKLDNSRL